MLYKIMQHLFSNDSFYRYTPRPWHIIYPVLLIGAGSVTFGQGWFVFGFLLIVFGTAMAMTIIVGMNWDKAIEYWSEIARVLEAAAHIKDPVIRANMLRSMGYNVTPDTITITERVEDKEGNLVAGFFKKVPASPAVMGMIADKVYMSKKTDFSEEEYKAIVPNIRKVKKEFKKKGYIVQKHKVNYRLGYAWTKKGLEALYQYTSEGVKIDLERKEKKEGDNE